jgi:CheY-like chemotaxis protein
MVMLIDDDKDDCDIFCEAVSQVTDCKCHCLHNPVDALSVLDRSQRLPDCIFLDINMPFMNGFAVLSKIKNDPKLSNIPIIVYSTTSNQKEVERSLDLGASRFVRKTSDYHRLVSSLKDVKRQLIDGA